MLCVCACIFGAVNCSSCCWLFWCAGELGACVCVCCVLRAELCRRSARHIHTHANTHKVIMRFRRYIGNTKHVLNSTSQRLALGWLVWLVWRACCCVSVCVCVCAVSCVCECVCWFSARSPRTRHRDWITRVRGCDTGEHTHAQWRCPENGSRSSHISSSSSNNSAVLTQFSDCSQSVRAVVLCLVALRECRVDYSIL